MNEQFAHIEVFETTDGHPEGEYIIAHERITDDFTLEMIREDYPGCNVFAGCICTKIEVEEVYA